MSERNKKGNYRERLWTMIKRLMTPSVGDPVQVATVTRDISTEYTVSGC